MLDNIEQRAPDLSPAERRVAHWVLAHPKQAAEATLAEVAAECGSSEPTVIRFCRHIGTDGFREFTLRLTEALSRPAIYVHRSVSADDDASDAVSKVMDASIRALIDVRARTSSMPFEEAITAMATARQIAFIGLGASGHVASDACHKFFRLGIPCTALTDNPSVLQFAAVVEENDVLVLVSHTGHWTELVQASNLARQNGATVIALTDPHSDLARSANILFPCQGREDTSVYTPMSSRLAHLALLDALHVALALKVGDSAVKKLRSAKNALQSRASV